MFDHIRNPNNDIRTGLVLIQPSPEFEDEHLERILREYIENEELPDPILWPTQNPHPINEYNTEGYIAMAFPTLFPTGRADFRDHSRRAEELGLAEYFETLLRYKDGRFGSHPRYQCSLQCF
jgi:hypothetical protein